MKIILFKLRYLYFVKIRLNSRRQTLLLLYLSINISPRYLLSLEYEQYSVLFTQWHYIILFDYLYIITFDKKYIKSRYIIINTILVRIIIKTYRDELLLRVRRIIL